MADKDTIKQIIEIVTKNDKKLDELVNKNEAYQKSAGETEKSSKSLASSFFFVANNAKMVVGALKTTIQFMDKMAGAADKTWKASQRLGVTLEFYQKLERSTRTLKLENCLKSLLELKQ